MVFIVTIVLCVIICILTAVHFIGQGSKSGRLLAKIPGPRSFPIIGNTLNFIVPLEALWTLLRKYSDDYYSIYKFWLGHLPAVTIRHPDDVEILLSSQKHIEKSFFYEFLHPWLNQGLLTSTGSKWKMRRKTLTPAFHFNMLQEFVGVFVENSERMVNSLNDEDGEVVKDLVPFFAKYTLNTICETAMGMTLQDKDQLQEKYRNGVKHFGNVLFYRAARPWLKSDWIFSLTQKGREQREYLKDLHYFTNKIYYSRIRCSRAGSAYLTQIIKERKEYHETIRGKSLNFCSLEKSATHAANVPAYNIPVKKKRLAMLDLLINVQKECNGIDDLGIREEVDTFVLEGHDTTLMGMCFAVLLLAEHKEIQARARAEVDTLFQEANGKLGISELQSLSYLERCIKESLRLYPSVPSISRKLNDDMQLKKFLIPRGTIVSLHIYDVHRDPNFWPQPEVYDPDRFLPDLCKNRHPYSYIPFSAGPRNCIGQKFAMLELKIIIAHLLHHFYLEPVIELAKVRMVPDLVLQSVNPLDVKFVPIPR